MRACRVDANSAALDAALEPDWWIEDTHAVGPRAISGYPDRNLVARWDVRIQARVEYKRKGEGFTDAEMRWWERYVGLGAMLFTPAECAEFTARVRQMGTQ